MFDLLSQSDSPVSICAAVPLDFSRFPFLILRKHALHGSILDPCIYLGALYSLVQSIPSCSRVISYSHVRALLGPLISCTSRARSRIWTTLRSSCSRARCSRRSSLHPEATSKATFFAARTHTHRSQKIWEFLLAVLFRLAGLLARWRCVQLRQAKIQVLLMGRKRCGLRRGNIRI